MKKYLDNEPNTRNFNIQTKARSLRKQNGFRVGEERGGRVAQTERFEGGWREKGYRAQTWRESRVGAAGKERNNGG